MYVRTRSHQRKNGKLRQGFSLNETVRIDGQPRSKTLLNLGADFSIPKELWNEFTHQVEARLKGDTCIPFQDEAFTNKVDDTVERLPDKGYDITKKTKRLHLIDPTKIIHTDSRTFAGERVCLHAMEQLKLHETLVNLGFSERSAKTACAMMAGQILSPGSESHTHDWMTNTSSILDILNLDLSGERTLQRCAEDIYTHQHEIMKQMFGSTKNLLSFDETVVLYDLTNTLYHGKQKGELLRDCSLASLALTLDASGFPRGAEILPGNVREPGTLEPAITKLDGSKPTILMDAGIATQKNLRYLEEHGLDWICVDRRATHEVPDRKPDQEFTAANQMHTKVWELSSQNEAGGRFIYVNSKAKQDKDDEIVATQCAEFEKKLAELHQGLPNPYYLKNYGSVEREVGSLQKEYDKVSYLYEITVTPDKDTSKVKSVTFVRRPIHEFSEGYMIHTSHTEWAIETVVQTSWQLTEIDSVFQSMKSDLGPAYHSKDECISAHLFISVLAYHVIHLAQYKLKQKGIHHNWDTVRIHLNRVRRTTTRLHKNQHCYLVMEVDEKLPLFLHRIFEILEIRYDPDATRTVTEHVIDPNLPMVEKATSSGNPSNP